jgi:hypothetical protein
MTTELPMLADFAIRLAGGLAAMLLLTPVRVVPPAFFRTHCVVMLGLLVLASLAEGLGVPRPVLGGTILGAVMAYGASVCWGIGLPRLGAPMTATVALVCLSLMIGASWDPSPLTFLWMVLGRVASAGLMGATLTAMLLGHHYLVTPAMSITPLRRFVLAIFVFLIARTALALPGLLLWFSADPGSGSGTLVSPLFLGMRWGMGILGPAVAAVLTWKTVAIRSTQSATGILYIAMTLVLFGELTAMILARGSGVVY